MIHTSIGIPLENDIAFHDFPIKEQAALKFFIRMDEKELQKYLQYFDTCHHGRDCEMFDLCEIVLETLAKRAFRHVQNIQPIPGFGKKPGPVPNQSDKLEQIREKLAHLKFHTADLRKSLESQERFISQIEKLLPFP